MLVICLIALAAFSAGYFIDHSHTTNTSSDKKFWSGKLDHRGVGTEF